MPYKRIRRGKTEWYGKVMVDGVPVSKKFPSKTEARRWEAEEKDNIRSLKRTDTISLAYLANKYLDAVVTRISPENYKVKVYYLRKVIAFLGANTPVRNIHYEDIEKFLIHMKQEVSPITANRYKIHLIAMYNWGIKSLELPERCPWRVQAFKTEQTERYVPSLEDFFKVVDVAEGQDKNMLLLYLYTATRKSELFNLAWDDVDLENKMIRIWTKKRLGGKEYNWLPLVNEAIEVLKDQRLITPFKKYVFYCCVNKSKFTGRVRMMSNLCKRAGVKPFGFHSIRHLAASLMDKHNIPLKDIQFMLRHKKMLTTQRYVHSLGVDIKMLGTVFARPDSKTFVDQVVDHSK